MGHKDKNSRVMGNLLWITLIIILSRKAKTNGSLCTKEVRIYEEDLPHQLNKRLPEGGVEGTVNDHVGWRVEDEKEMTGNVK